MNQPEHQNENSFSYTYSAPEQAEIKKIRDKYAPPSERECTLERLRKLDRSVTVKGTVIALIMGVLGTLLFGAGMSCVMMWPEYFIAGIAMGLAGVALLAPAYPVYTRITEKERARLAPEILRLADELEKN